jgi:hypothetical protein
MLDAIIYDCEIQKCIPGKDGRVGGYNYCDGWQDFLNMGISCICAYDYMEDCYRIFFSDNMRDFQILARSREHVIGFNSVSFDDNLCRANGIIDFDTDYDLLCEVRIASGQPPHYIPNITRGGYSLGAIAETNLGVSKSGSGELAPKLWQQGKIGAVVDYCLRDVQLTKRLFDMAQADQLVDPTNGQPLKLRKLVDLS